MCFKKLLDRIDAMERDNRLILFVFLIIGMFGGIGYIGALIIPNWEVFIVYPMVYQFVAYSVIVLICFDISLIVIITMKTTIKNQVLSERNIKLEDEKEKRDKKVEELEAELNRLKSR